MAEGDVIPELKQILGAMVFGANRSLDVKEMRRCLREVAEQEGGATRAFAEVKESDIRQALEALAEDLRKARCGCVLAEIAGGFRFQSDGACGTWLRHLLNVKPARLSRPALETLAIIAYRQPISRTDIEAVRGVNVDHLMKSLLEMQIIRIAGRSTLPGRPFLYGTTQLFLEHFGLKSLDELKDMEPMLALAMASGSGPRAPGTAPAPAATEPVHAEPPAGATVSAVEIVDAGEVPADEGEAADDGDEDEADEDDDDEEDDEEEEDESDDEDDDDEDDEDEDGDDEEEDKP